MSPEQAPCDVAVGAQTDIDALGCVRYEMLTGEPPYTGKTAQAVLGRMPSERRYPFGTGPLWARSGQDSPM